jgi:membrane-associated protein
VPSFVEHLTGLVAHHADLAYLAVFLAALLEAVPVVGSVVPGSTIILALSALIGARQLHLIPFLGAAICGAIAGDGAAFWIGHRRQREILNAWPMSRYPGLIAQSEAFFHRYGTLAVFFARFVAPVRAFVPLTAGALDMAPRRFYTINITAIVLWACSHTLPGVLAVSVFERYRPLIRHYWFPVVIAAGLIAGIAFWAIRRCRGINRPVKPQRSP